MPTILVKSKYKHKKMLHLYAGKKKTARTGGSNRGADGKKIQAKGHFNLKSGPRNFAQWCGLTGTLSRCAER